MACIVIIVSSVIASWYSIKQKNKKKMKSQLFLDFFKWSSG